MRAVQFADGLTDTQVFGEYVAYVLAFSCLSGSGQILSLYERHEHDCAAGKQDPYCVLQVGPSSCKSRTSTDGGEQLRAAGAHAVATANLDLLASSAMNK